MTQDTAATTPGDNPHLAPDGIVDRLDGQTMWMAMSGAEVRYYDAAGIRTRAIEAGEGPPLVMLHGMGGHAESYAYNIVELAKDFHVYSIDMVGHGLTDKPETMRFELPDYVKHLGDFIEAIGADRVYLEGESLGGWVATYYAWANPDKVIKLINCTGGGLRWPEGDPAEVKRIRHEEMVPINRAVVDDLNREVVRRRVDHLFWRKDLVTDEIVDTRFAIYSRPDMRRTFPKITATLGNQDDPVRVAYALTPERLAEIKVPTLWLWTDHNPGTGVEGARRAHELTPGSQLVVMEECGHWPQWEDAATFNRLCREFLLS